MRPETEAESPATATTTRQERLLSPASSLRVTLDKSSRKSVGKKPSSSPERLRAVFSRLVIKEAPVGKGGLNAKDRAVEQIIATIHAAGERSAKERHRMEEQLEEECRRLQTELCELKATRKRLLKENNRLHLKAQQIRQSIGDGEEELRRVVDAFRAQHSRAQALELAEVTKLTRQREDLKILIEARQKSEVDAKRVRESNSVQIVFLEKQMEILRNQLTFLQATQRVYYTSLLKEGADCRNKGLWWVVKQLIKIDVCVDHSNFPEIIDQPAVKYLKSTAKIMLKLEKEERATQISITSNASRKIDSILWQDTPPDSPKTRFSPRQKKVVPPRINLHPTSNIYKMGSTFLFKKRCFSLSDSHWFTTTESGGKPRIDLKKMQTLEQFASVRSPRKQQTELTRDYDSEALPTGRATLLRAFENLKRREVKRVQALLENPFSELRRRKVPAHELSEMLFGNRNYLFDYTGGMVGQETTQLVSQAASSSYFSRESFVGI